MTAHPDDDGVVVRLTMEEAGMLLMLQLIPLPQRAQAIAMIMDALAKCARPGPEEIKQ